MSNPTPSSTVTNYGSFGPNTETELETVFLIKESGAAAQTINPDVTFAGAMTVTGAQTLTGNTSLAGTLAVTGATTLSSTAAVTGLASLNGGAAITGTIVGGKQPIIPTGATIAPTAAQCGSLILFGATGGSVVTLPAPAVGLWYDLVITVTNTSASNEIRTNAGTVFLLGAVQHSATGIAPLDFWANGTSTQAIKMDGAHLGGLIGSTFHVACISATQWAISGINLGTATMTTAFNDTP